MDIDIFGILIDSIYALAALFFIVGLLLTAATGNTKPVKILLWSLSGFFVLLIAVGFAFTPFLIFLLFQIVALILFWYLCIVAGAVCGGGLYSLRHRRRIGETLTQNDMDDYVPLAQFCAQEAIDEERALARIRSGYYRGGNFGGSWYIHRSEQSRRAP